MELNTLDIRNNDPNIEFHMEMILLREISKIYSYIIKSNYNSRIHNITPTSLCINITSPCDLLFELIRKLYNIEDPDPDYECIYNDKSIVEYTIFTSINDYTFSHLSIFMIRTEEYRISHITPSNEQLSIITLGFNNYKDIYIEYK